MSNIPDFATQMTAVQCQIEAQSDVTAQDWNDVVQRRYYQDYVNVYKERIDIYLNGGTQISGKGLNELLVYVSDLMTQMEQLTGIAEDISYISAMGTSSCDGCNDY